MVTASLVAADTWWSSTIANRNFQHWQESQNDNAAAEVPKTLDDRGIALFEQLVAEYRRQLAVDSVLAERTRVDDHRPIEPRPVVGVRLHQHVSGDWEGFNDRADDWQLVFQRQGQDVVDASHFHVVDGVHPEALARGPGRYPGSVNPGELGNVAIAGHRTTHGAPFRDLDQLQAGDAIHLRHAGKRWTYRVAALDVVTPAETWVVGSDPLGTGAPTLTLTTCHPKHRASHRLVVWATYEDPAAS